MKDKKITKVIPIPKIVTIDNIPMRKKRVAAYARVSTSRLEQQTSFDAQVDYYIKYISEHTEWEFVKVYSDEGISGCRTNQREGFMEMINDCKKVLDGVYCNGSRAQSCEGYTESCERLSTIRCLESVGRRG